MLFCQPKRNGSPICDCNFRDLCDDKINLGFPGRVQDKILQTRSEHCILLGYNPLENNNDGQIWFWCCLSKLERNVDSNFIYNVMVDWPACLLFTS